MPRTLPNRQRMRSNIPNNKDRASSAQKRGRGMRPGRAWAVSWKENKGTTLVNSLKKDDDL